MTGRHGQDALPAAIARIPEGHVRTWFSPDVIGTVGELGASLESGPDARLLLLTWRAVPGAGPLIRETIAALAELALAVWPDWYGETGLFAYPDLGDGLAAEQDELVVKQVGEPHPALDREWARKAAARCRAGKAPILRDTANQVQLRQLMLALMPRGLTLVMALEAEREAPERLLAFARACTWIAAETGTPVAVVLPRVHHGKPELDAIAYQAVVIEGEAPAAEEGLTAAVQPPVRGPRLYCAPLLGRPHPASSGEQLLARWLARDEELAPLFAFNQRVTVASGESYIVDVLWRDGKLAVEVDGYTWHSSPQMFASDRERDYQLLCDGFRTLRLPHDEVLNDPALQCEKIRKVVHMIRRGETHE